MRNCRFPAIFSSSQNKRAPHFQVRKLIFSKYEEILTTAVGSSCIIFLCASVAVRSSGFRVAYIPPGDRKSGMPLDTDTPAPKTTATLRSFFTRSRLIMELKLLLAIFTVRAAGGGRWRMFYLKEAYQPHYLYA